MSNPPPNPTMSVISESGCVSGGAERSSSTTSDASAFGASNSDEDGSNVPYKGYINGPQRSVTGTGGTAGPGPRYVESSDSDEEPQPPISVELSTGTSSNSDKLSATPVDGDAQGLQTTQSKYLSVVGERGVMMTDSTDGTGVVEVINTDCSEVSGTRDSPAGHVSIFGSEKQESDETETTDEKPPQSGGRMVQRRPTVTTIETAADNTVVVELIVDNSFVPSAVPELQHARITSEHVSSFDELKSFLAQIHSTGVSYVRPTQRFSIHPGQAISSLKFFLANIE